MLISAVCQPVQYSNFVLCSWLYCFVCFIEWLQQIVLIAVDFIKRTEWKGLKLWSVEAKVCGGADGTGCEGSR
jgi:hypothetical protein